MLVSLTSLVSQQAPPQTVWLVPWGPVSRLWPLHRLWILWFVSLSFCVQSQPIPQTGAQSHVPQAQGTRLEGRGELRWYLNKLFITLFKYRFVFGILTTGDVDVASLDSCFDRIFAWPRSLSSQPLPLLLLQTAIEDPGLLHQRSFFIVGHLWSLCIVPLFTTKILAWNRQDMHRLMNENLIANHLNLYN